MALLRAVLDLCVWVLLIRILVDLVPSLGKSAFGRGLVSSTEPLLLPVRRVLPRIVFGEVEFDVSALVIVLVLSLVLNLIS